MNIRFFVTCAYHSWVAFAAAARLDRAFHKESTSTILPRDLHIRFHGEVFCNDQIIMQGGVVSVTDDAVTLYHELRVQNRNNLLAASFCVILDHVDSKRAVRFPWSKKSRESLSELIIPAIPDYASPRSVDMTTPASAGSYERATELKVPVCGLAALTPDNCDAFERMRPDVVMARQSESAANMTPDWLTMLGDAFTRQKTPIEPANVVVETRIAFCNWPQAGDLLQSHIGLVEATPKTWRVVHWLVDPATGTCWAETETIMAHFDNAARRVIAVPEELNNYVDSLLVKGLTL